MQLADDRDAAEWLGGLGGETEDFAWDSGNRNKNRKHGVEPADVEALFAHPALLAGRIIEPAHNEPRWLLLGQDEAGRRLALIFTRRGNRVRPISCRPMRNKERQLYDEALQKEGSPDEGES